MHPESGPAMTDPAHPYAEAVGAVHLHSVFSDGSLPIPEIAEIAEKKALDFLMFSDHHTLAPNRQGLEGWHGSVLVLVGYEINDPDDRNHYLAFQLRDEVEGRTPDAYVRQVRKAYPGDHSLRSLSAEVDITSLGIDHG